MRHSRQNPIGPTTPPFLTGNRGTTIAVIASLVSVGVLVAILTRSELIDFLVYRMGARVLLDGDDIYGQMPPVTDDFALPFTYPPLSAMLFAPLALIPVTLGKIVFTLVSVAALVVTLRVVLDRLRPDFEARTAWIVTTVAVAGALVLEPVRETISFGQINLVLMALVALDVLAKNPKWPRGLLIGLAAAVKLTPIAFLLLFLLRRDRRTSATILASTLGFTALAFAVMPTTSAKYWMDTLPDTGRIGASYFATNQSFKAVVSRFGPPELVGSVLWLIAVAVMLLVAVVAIRRALEQGDLMLALFANATAVLLASPVSWSHHWVWIAPALLTLSLAAWRATDPQKLAAIAAGVALVFAIGPHHLFPTGGDLELEWAAWQHLFGTLYVTVGFGFLLWLTFGRLPGPEAVAPEPLPDAETSK
ncbi:glycosyltransferase 87 family protein [Rhodococcus sp. B50]|uniref:glycosyltransferase 87 family protein n=1 Tax=Rhodococcus sp. B50 TaxID=2682847 RepID=UPI001BD21037|nr:glycosyltransferase 87 family protein [Rhodococcus sp. B50]MBS9374509.1 Polyprenol-phosphate-mannose-dependent alpha-(1-2)-phosphatidylinositol mannoside mannosyltransferase [Rhodococcus sp. B50]